MSLPTLYEYYTGGGIRAGLSADQEYFTLNNRNITLYSGAMHHFRVPPSEWRDRLRKMRAAGLNTVETYLAWNLHETEPGVFDFGQGGSEFQDFVAIEKFFKTVQEEDMLAIVRPGPYICAEWEFGSFPSWLLREKDIKFRTSDKIFMGYVEKFFGILLPVLAALQFTAGGPIVAFQIENEYASFDKRDKQYLRQLRQLYLDNGIKELLFTSDAAAYGNRGTLPELLKTANFDYVGNNFDKLKKLQPGKPSMAMEFYSGWLDHWTEGHHRRATKDFIKSLEKILTYPASFNIYMFQGGTNWGFMNGANIDMQQNYQPDTSSYDYGAPLTEAGDYTPKYFAIKEILTKYNTVQTKLPDLPLLKKRIPFATIEINRYMDIGEMLRNVPAHHKTRSETLISMENIPKLNNGSGQHRGYIVYRKEGIDIPANSVLKVDGQICDTLMVLINGKLKTKILEKESDLNGFGYWRLRNGTLDLGNVRYANAKLELVVENWGRNNYGSMNNFYQYKGLWQGPVSINDRVLSGWEIVPLEFKKTWTNSLKGWKRFHSSVKITGPALYTATLKVGENVTDTFIDMRNWKKGIVIVNGFVLSRYFRVGPQQTAYLPASFLHQGKNRIVIFEHFVASDSVKFSADAVYETIKNK